MNINSFIKEVMPTSVLLKEEISNLVSQANSAVNSSLLELYISNSNDAFFEINIRVRGSYPLSSHKECQSRFEAEDKKYPFRIHEDRMSMFNDMSVLVKKENKLDSMWKKNLNKSYLITSSLYIPSKLWLNQTVYYFKNKEKVCKEIPNTEIGRLANKLIITFASLYSKLLVKKIFVLLGLNTTRYNEVARSKRELRDFQERLKNSLVKVSSLDKILNGALDILSAILFIDNSEEDKRYRESKLKLQEKENHLINMEEKARCEYEIGNQELICLLKDVSEYMMLKYTSFDILNRVRDGIDELDSRTNNINLLILDALVIFNSKKNNIQTEFTYKCENEFINNLVEKTSNLTKDGTVYLVEKVISNLNEEADRKFGFKKICLDEITKIKKEMNG